MPENIPIYAVVGVAVAAIILIAAITTLISTFFTVVGQSNGVVARDSPYIVLERRSLPELDQRSSPQESESPMASRRSP